MCLQPSCWRKEEGCLRWEAPGNQRGRSLRSTREREEQDSGPGSRPSPAAGRGGGEAERAGDSALPAARVGRRRIRRNQPRGDLVERATPDGEAGARPGACGSARHPSPGRSPRTASRGSAGSKSRPDGALAEELHHLVARLAKLELRRRAIFLRRRGLRRLGGRGGLGLRLGGRGRGGRRGLRGRSWSGRGRRALSLEQAPQSSAPASAAALHAVLSCSWSHHGGSRGRAGRAPSGRATSRPRR